MENPGIAIRRIPQARSRTARYVGGAFVGALHVLAIYALANGLAIKLVKEVPKLIETRIIQPPPKPKETPPPKPELKMPAPPKIQTFVPPPEIKIATPPPPPTAVQQVQTITPPPPAPPQQPAPVTPPAPPPPAAPAIPDSEAVGIASTHTTPPYPPVAHRLGKEGTVMLHISISATGDVTDASVASSSGNDELDQAAVEWVKSHWRYKPAIRNGQPAASTAQVAVKFTLQNAGAG
jgi:periplasmic protein TonB